MYTDALCRVNSKPGLSNCTRVLHPIDIARFGTSDIPNLALVDNSAYRRGDLKKENGKYEMKYMIPPAAAPALAGISQTNRYIQ